MIEINIVIFILGILQIIAILLIIAAIIRRNDWMDMSVQYAIGIGITLLLITIPLTFQELGVVKFV